MARKVTDIPFIGCPLIGVVLVAEGLECTQSALADLGPSVIDADYVVIH
jgi:hypothetical protein